MFLESSLRVLESSGEFWRVDCIKYRDSTQRILPWIIVPLVQRARSVSKQIRAPTQRIHPSQLIQPPGRQPCKRSNDKPNNEPALRSVLFFEKWRNGRRHGKRTSGGLPGSQRFPVSPHYAAILSPISPGSSLFIQFSSRRLFPSASPASLHRPLRRSPPLPGSRPPCSRENF